MKIAVIGYSGSGKSTLARFLSETIHEEVLYLDTVHWLPGWNERKKEERLAIVKKFLDTHSGWVIDGTYGVLEFARRMEEADKIIFLNLNRFACLRRAFQRKNEYKGKDRFSMTEGCPERISWEFFWWLLVTGRTKRRKNKFQRLKEQYANKLIELKNQKQIDCFMEEVKKGKL